MASEDESPTKPAFAPFADSAAVESLGGLTFENGTASIAVHGALDLTRDRRGLARAKKLRSLLDAIVTALESQDLPEAVAEETKADQSVPNPFA